MSGSSIPAGVQPNMTADLAKIALTDPQAMDFWLNQLFESCAGWISVGAFSESRIEDWVVAGTPIDAFFEPNCRITACARLAANCPPFWDMPILERDGATPPKCLVVTLVHPNGAHVQLRLDPDGVEVRVPQCAAQPSSQVGALALASGEPVGDTTDGSQTPDASVSDDAQVVGCRHIQSPTRLRPAVDAAQALVFWKTALRQTNDFPAHPADTSPAAGWIS